MEEYPNWVEMPDDLMANIFQRLDTKQILNSARKVCKTWKRICKDPAMWKVIDIRKPVNAPDADYDLERLTKQAVYLSCGELIDISIKGFGTNDLLDYILLRSSKLKSLCLKDCYKISSKGLSRALEWVPQLEKLQLSYTSHMVEYIGQDFIRNCPQLKSFKLDKALDQAFIRVRCANDNEARAIAKKMPELRHLQLYGNRMTNVGLQAILNGCPHLESLDIRMCYNICLQGSAIGTRCMEGIKKLKGFKGPDG